MLGFSFANVASLLFIKALQVNVRDEQRESMMDVDTSFPWKIQPSRSTRTGSCGIARYRLQRHSESIRLVDNCDSGGLRSPAALPLFVARSEASWHATGVYSERRERSKAVVKLLTQQVLTHSVAAYRYRNYLPYLGTCTLLSLLCNARKLETRTTIGSQLLSPRAFS